MTKLSLYILNGICGLILALSSVAFANSDCEILISLAHPDKILDWTGYHPEKYLKQRVASTISTIKSRDFEKIPSKLSKPRLVKIKPKRNKLTKGILYKEKILEASSHTMNLFDKLIMSKALEYFLENRFEEFHPKTEGLKDFLSQKKLVNSSGKIIASRQKIKEIFEKEFPKGFLLKPPVGWSSSGKSFYIDQEEIYNLLSSGDSDIYHASDFAQPFISDFRNVLTSGEQYMIQAKIDGTRVLEDEDLSKVSKSTDFSQAELNEYRVHTFYDKVIEGGTVSRWETRDSMSQIEKVNQFVQEFLDALPQSFTLRQAWSVDVFITPTGEMKLVEINTNHGEPTNWSGWLKYRWILGAYIRHLESNFGWRFQGLPGWQLRNNWGNLLGHYRIEWIEDVEMYKKGLILVPGWGMLQREINFHIKDK